MNNNNYTISNSFSQDPSNNDTSTAAATGNDYHNGSISSTRITRSSKNNPCSDSCLLPLLRQLGDHLFPVSASKNFDFDSEEHDDRTEVSKIKENIPAKSDVVTVVSTDPKELSYKEWVVESGIDRKLWELNCIPIYSYSEVAYRLYSSDDLDRRNDGRLVDKHYRQHLNMSTGWWADGYETDWGCFKPYEPRTDAKGKIIKYEHPERRVTGIFAPKVNRDLAQRIVRKQCKDLRFPKKVKAENFWEWFLEKPGITLYITEGVKKAAALMSVGMPAIAVPGIWAIADPGNKKELSPQLKRFCFNRNIVIVYDAPDRETTASDINAACRRWGELFRQSMGVGAKNEISFVAWNESKGKGIDDYLVRNGEKATQDLLIKERVEYWDLRYYGNRRIVTSNHIVIDDDLQYLGDSLKDPKYNDAFSKKLVGLKVPKGGGKSRTIQNLIGYLQNNQEFKNSGYPQSYMMCLPVWENMMKILSVSHRVSLSKAEAEKLGLYRAGEETKRGEGAMKAYGLASVINSLHAKSQAQFDPDEWNDAIILWDEADQGIRDLLASSTLVSCRMDVIRNLAIVFSRAKQIIVASADLDMNTIKFVQKMGGISEDNTQIIEKVGKPNTYNCHTYEEGTPEIIFSQMLEDIGEGKKILCACSSQKVTSKYSAQNQETRIKDLFPETRVLRIDSDTRVNKDHPAHYYIKNMNQAIKDFDVILYTSVIGTGVDITEPGVDTVYGIFFGCQSPDESRQMLMRYRITKDCDRRIWTAQVGLAWMAGGYFCPKIVKYSQDKRESLHLAALSQLAIPVPGYETADELPARNAYAEIAATNNYEMKNYRKLVYKGLEDEGVTLISTEDMSTPPPLGRKEIMEEVAKENTTKYFEKVLTDGEFLNDDEQEALKKKKSEGGLTTKEQLSDVKTRARKMISSKYSRENFLPEIDTELIDRIITTEWSKQIRLHFYLQNPGYVVLIDTDTVDSASEKNLYSSDLYSRLFALKLSVLEPLNLFDLTKPGIYHQEHPTIKRIYAMAIANKSAIKSALGISIDEAHPMTAIKSLCDSIGLSCKIIKQRVQLPSGTRSTTFTHFAPGWEPIPNLGRTSFGALYESKDDRREEIYTIWKEDFRLHIEVEKAKAEQMKKMANSEMSAERQREIDEFCGIIENPLEKIEIILPEVLEETLEDYKEMFDLAEDTKDDQLFESALNAMPESFEMEAIATFIEDRLTLGMQNRIHRLTNNMYAKARDYQTEVTR